MNSVEKFSVPGQFRHGLLQRLLKQRIGDLFLSAFHFPAQIRLCREPELIDVGKEIVQAVPQTAQHVLVHRERVPGDSRPPAGFVRQRSRDENRSSSTARCREK